MSFGEEMGWSVVWGGDGLNTSFGEERVVWEELDVSLKEKRGWTCHLWRRRLNSDLTEVQRLFRSEEEVRLDCIVFDCFPFVRPLSHANTVCILFQNHYTQCRASGLFI